MKARKKGFMHLLLIGLLVLLTGCTSKGKNGFVDGRNFGGIVETTKAKTETAETTRSTAVFSGACYGVILEIDQIRETVTIRDLVTNAENQYTYSGGTYIMDKYGKDISISQLAPGDVVEGGYDTGTRKLIELQKSDRVWENKNVTKFTIDRVAKTIQIGNTLYEYKDNLVIVSDDRILESVDEISNNDELIIYGNENTIYSIVINKGHGYVVLTGSEYFEGGWVMVGSQIAQKVTKNMVIEVPEGKYVLEITKNGVGGRMDIVITKNHETEVNVAALKGELIESGSLRFEIEPAEAKLYIDNKSTDYEDLVKLEYGTYKIKVTADGYVTYTGDLVVSEYYQKREIRLGKEETATEASETTAQQESTSADETETSSNTTETGTEETRPASTETTSATVTTSTSAASGPTVTTPTVTAPTVTTPSVAVPTVTAPTVTTPFAPGATEAQSEGMGSDMSSEKIAGYKIHVEAPVGASVYFDGEYVGVAPVSFDKISGEHTIIFKQDGYEPKTYTVTISSDKADSHYSYPALVPN